MKGEITVQEKTGRWLIDEMERITTTFFCEHIDKFIELANAENRCYVLVDEDSKEEVILVPISVYEKLSTPARFMTVREQMKQHNGKTMSEIIKDAPGAPGEHMG